jgi:heme exporter protein D
MLESHLSYLAVAYGFTALAIAIECVVLLRTRRQSIEQVRRERDLDLDDHHESIADPRNEAATP